VQLAAADEHRADLSQLAVLARAPVGLGVDDEELRRRKRLAQQIHEHMFRWRPDAVHELLQPRFAPASEAVRTLGICCQRPKRGAT